jgi:hypothetical protein
MIDFDAYRCTYSCAFYVLRAPIFFGQVSVKWNEKISDMACRNFFKQFYLSLFIGNKSVTESFHVGLAAVKLNQSKNEAAKFILHTSKNALSKPIFREMKDGDWENVTERIHLKSLPARIPFMLGRQIETQYLFALLCHHQRLVCLFIV